MIRYIYRGELFIYVSKILYQKTYTYPPYYELDFYILAHVKTPIIYIIIRFILLTFLVFYSIFGENATRSPLDLSMCVIR